MKIARYMDRAGQLFIDIGLSAEEYDALGSPEHVAWNLSGDTFSLYPSDDGVRVQQASRVSKDTCKRLRIAGSVFPGTNLFGVEKVQTETDPQARMLVSGLPKQNRRKRQVVRRKKTSAPEIPSREPELPIPQHQHDARCETVRSLLNRLNLHLALVPGLRFAVGENGNVGAYVEEVVTREI